jgi:hypothetical protein
MTKPSCFEICRYKFLVMGYPGKAASKYIPNWASSAGSCGPWKFSSIHEIKGEHWLLTKPTLSFFPEPRVRDRSTELLVLDSQLENVAFCLSLSSPDSWRHYNFTSIHESKGHLFVQHWLLAKTTLLVRSLKFTIDWPSSYGAYKSFKFAYNTRYSIKGNIFFFYLSYRM